MKNRKVIVEDWGFISYEDAWKKQREIREKLMAIKRKNRDEGTSLPTENYLIFCEHPHVYTLGKSGSEDNLLLEKQELKIKGIDFYHVERGGDITYHGPGQSVVYPIFDLENFKPDIIWFVRNLEEVVIRTLKHYDIQGERLPKFSGVWIEPRTAPRKIAALGVHTGRWITMHGLALNVTTNLEYFSYIIPCGIRDKDVTSIEKEIGEKVPLQEVNAHLKEAFKEVFGIEEYL